MDLLIVAQIVIVFVFTISPNSVCTTSHYAHRGSLFWRIETCSPCLKYKETHRGDIYKACDLFALKHRLNETLGIVQQIQREVTEQYSVDFSTEHLSPDTDGALLPVGYMIRSAYIALQNITLTHQIIAHFRHRYDIPLGMRHVDVKLKALLCDIDRIIRSGNFYEHTRFLSCLLEDSSFRYVVPSTSDVINYVVNFIVESKYQIQRLIGNINHIVINY